MCTSLTPLCHTKVMQVAHILNKEILLFEFPITYPDLDHLPKKLDANIRTTIGLNHHNPLWERTVPCQKKASEELVFKLETELASKSFSTFMQIL